MTAFRTATLLAWDQTTGSNRLRLLDGHEIVDAPVIAAATRHLTIGDRIGLIRYGAEWVVVGRLRDGN